jgi:hypothetical protein
VDWPYPRIVAGEIDRGEEAAVQTFLSHPAVSSLLRQAQAMTGDLSSAIDWVLWRLTLMRPEDTDALAALSQAFWDHGLRDWLLANGHEDVVRSRAVPDDLLAGWADDLRGGL